MHAVSALLIGPCPGIEWKVLDVGLTSAKLLGKVKVILFNWMAFILSEWFTSLCRCGCSGWTRILHRIGQSHTITKKHFHVSMSVTSVIWCRVSMTGLKRHWLGNLTAVHETVCSIQRGGFEWPLQHTRAAATSSTCKNKRKLPAYRTALNSNHHNWPE